MASAPALRADRAASPEFLSWLFPIALFFRVSTADNQPVDAQAREAGVQVYVNEKPFECAVAAGETVGDLVARVRESASSPGRLLLGICADGADITGADYAEALVRPADSVARLDFKTGQARDLVADALPFCEEMLDRAEETRQSVIEQLTQGKSAEGLAALGQCCAAWRQVHESIVNALHFLELDAQRLSVGGRPLPESVADMKPPLNQIREALEARDLVLISDVLQYEFEPVIQNWRDTITALHAEAGPAPAEPPCRRADAARS